MTRSKQGTDHQIIFDLPTPQRLAMAENADTPADRLALLAGDGNMWVRHAAANNPSTPGDVLESLRQAGSSDDLKSSVPAQQDVSTDALQALAHSGEWARSLAARHPRTPPDIIDQLATDQAVTVRRAVARRTAAPPSPSSFDRLLTDIDATTRSLAATNPHAPADLTSLLIAAGSTPDLTATVAPRIDQPPPEQLAELAQMGFWARVLAARHPNTPTDSLTTLSRDHDWRVRAALAENPSASESMLEGLIALDVPEVHTLLAQHPHAPADLLKDLAEEQNVMIRVRVAGHTNAPPEVLARLLEDGAQVVRAAALANAKTPRSSIDRLVAAGSSPDLSATVEDRSPLPHDTLAELAAGGPWAKRLAATHPNTPAEVLEALAVDADFLIREMVATHPNRPGDRITLLVRAGSSDDLQSYASPDTSMTATELAEVSRLGPWAKRIVSRHPAADAGLLTQLASDGDWQVRRSVARHDHTPDEALIGLAQDFAADVRWSVLNRKHTPTEALTLLARDELATIRLEVAADPRTPQDLLDALTKDLDEDVRRTASERLSK